MNENIKIPENNWKAIIIRSRLLLGVKSPSPTVDKDVNEKYMKVTV